MRCSPSTRLYGLLGSPVHGSLSPVIHCTVFREAGVDAVYLAWDTPGERLGDAVRGLRVLAGGFNVTIPHKVSVMALLDRVSGEAEEIGAVNTVAVRDGRLIGYNTDYLGVARCIEEKKHRPRRALVIGAGGAARAAVYALARLGAVEVVVANRSRGRGVELAAWARGLGLEARYVPLEEASREAARADTVVNATPVGSYACCPGEAPPVLEGLHQGQLVFDMVYRPLRTRLLREAEKRGAVTVDGLCMLVWQALEADRIWESVEPSAALYRAARRAALRELGEEDDKGTP